MADNRLWLVHRPTGKSVFLGKRMAIGWYTNRDDADIGANIREFFAAIYGEFPQDDFVLAIEDAEEAPACTDKFKYGADHKPHLEG